MTKKVQLPEISENVTQGEVIDVLVQVGDAVAQEQPLIELETEKAAVQIPSPFAGTVTELKVGRGDTVTVGQTIAVLETESGAGTKDTGRTEKARPAAEARPETPAANVKEKAKEREAETGRTDGELRIPAAVNDQEPVPASPTVRRLARELGIDIRRVFGSGPGGRISAADVKAFVKNRSGLGGGAAGEETPGLPDFSRFGTIRREKMNQVRRITARNTSFAWRTIPHVTQFDEADITGLGEFLDRYRKQAEKAGGKLTVTAVAVKVLALIAREHPEFNASLDPAADEIIFKDFVHVGIAVATPRGLLVPVIRDADTKGLIELAAEMTDLADRARNKKVTPDELEGGTITISNIGGIGGTGFTPVVYWPQAAIVGMARAQERPVVVKKEIMIRTILPLSLSYDHRLIDGADGARFLRRFAEILENPYSLLL